MTVVIFFSGSIILFKIIFYLIFFFFGSRVFIFYFQFKKITILPLNYVVFVLYLLWICVLNSFAQARKHIFEIHTRDWNPKLAEPFVEELAEKCVGKVLKISPNCVNK